MSGDGCWPAFYIDDLRLIAAPLPVLPETVHIRVDATQRIRTVDARLFGVNAAIKLAAPSPAHPTEGAPVNKSDDCRGTLRPEWRI